MPHISNYGRNPYIISWNKSINTSDRKRLKFTPKDKSICTLPSRRFSAFWAPTNYVGESYFFNLLRLFLIFSFFSLQFWLSFVELLSFYKFVYFNYFKWNLSMIFLLVLSVICYSSFTSTIHDLIMLFILFFIRCNTFRWTILWVNLIKWMRF